MRSSVFTTQQIATEITYNLRSQILRPGLDLQFSKFEGDDESETFHLGVFIQNCQRPICIGTFMKRICKHFPNIANAYQLRGMATDSDFQGKGCGRMILQEAEKILIEKKQSLLWMNARLSARLFYKKSGYTAVGEEFNIPQVGPHVVMYKQLK